MLLFHITLQENRRSIQRGCIDPQYAKGRYKKVWLCDNARVIWALSHCSIRWGVPVSALLICVVSLPIEKLQRSAWQGVYTCNELVKVSQFQHPRRYMQDFEARWKNGK